MCQLIFHNFITIYIYIKFYLVKIFKIIDTKYNRYGCTYSGRCRY